MQTYFGVGTTLDDNYFYGTLSGKLGIKHMIRAIDEPALNPLLDYWPNCLDISIEPRIVNGAITLTCLRVALPSCALLCNTANACRK
jgi:hypothetical protein